MSPREPESAALATKLTHLACSLAIFIRKVDEHLVRECANPAVLFQHRGGSKKGRKFSTEAKVRMSASALKREEERRLKRAAARHGERV